MNVLAGSLAADHGEAILDGRPLRAGSPRAALAAGIAAVHQSPMLFERMTWEENLALGGFDANAGALDLDASRGACALARRETRVRDAAGRRHRRESFGCRARSARSAARAQLQSAGPDSRRTDQRARSVGTGRIPGLAAQSARRGPNRSADYAQARRSNRSRRSNHRAAPRPRGRPHDSGRDQRGETGGPDDW